MLYSGMRRGRLAPNPWFCGEWGYITTETRFSIVSEVQANRWKRYYSPRLRELKEVCGVGVTRSGTGDSNFVVAVLLKTDATSAIEQEIAAILKDVPFKIIVTGPFELLPA
jgi:hypothetical protein